MYTILTINVVYVTSLCWKLGGGQGRDQNSDGTVSAYFIVISKDDSMVAEILLLTQLCLHAAGLFEAHWQYLATELVFG